MADKDKEWDEDLQDESKNDQNKENINDEENDENSSESNENQNPDENQNESEEHKKDIPESKISSFFRKIKEGSSSIFFNTPIKHIFSTIVITMIAISAIFIMPTVIGKVIQHRSNKEEIGIIKFNSYDSGHLLYTDIFMGSMEITKYWLRTKEINNEEIPLVFLYPQEDLPIAKALNKYNILLINSSTSSEKLKNLYTKSNIFFETGDMLISLEENQETFNKNKNPLAILNSLSNSSKVGIYSNINSKTFDKTISCKYTSFIYDKMQALINDLVNHRIDYAIVSRIDALAEINPMYGNSSFTDSIILHPVPITSCGPCLAIKNSLPGGSLYLDSFNDLIDELISTGKLGAIYEMYGVNYDPSLS